MIQRVGDNCCGCTACSTICPVNCIQMTQDELGFLKPEVDMEICTQCGKCISVCPAIKVKYPTEPAEVYCGWSTNDELRHNSSSGGAFPALAEKVMSEGGIVYGAVVDIQAKRVHHESTRSVLLREMQGSKYVQSDPGGTFKDVLCDLGAGKTVFFAGTPCQVNGLKNIVGESNDKLIVCDFICHGVSSPLVFNNYVAYMEDKFSSSAVSINFRNKSKGWSRPSTEIGFSSGRKYLQRNTFDMFYRGFVDCFHHGTACYNCPHNAYRSSDITLSDFWHHKVMNIDLNDEKGLSLVVSNSDKGGKLMKEISLDGFYSVEVSESIGLIESKVRIGTPEILQRREKFASLASERGVLYALRKTTGISKIGMIVRKLQNMGCRQLIARVRRKIVRK